MSRPQDPDRAQAPLVSVLIPAHNEADYIETCLAALFASDPLPAGIQGEVLVLTNGCTDDTARIAAAMPVPPGWHCSVLDLPEGNKLKALNAGDAVARGAVLIYLDADVLVAPDLIDQITSALSCSEPRYASGTPHLAPAQSALTRAYGRFWMQLPFVQNGTPGFGLFAMNRTGRARWQKWPDIIADDMFARLSFAPTERVKLPASYSWPMVEGFRNLTRVRRRQNAGVTELAKSYPELLVNEDKTPLGPKHLLRLLIQDPVGFASYALVSLAVKSSLFRSAQRWTRGR
ncbi:glycosyltransferase [Pseudophaeobacter sp.]|uniref:glycosyltransferase family 2 protein n=1 Tax=Pseudophaeobacter sp. TaxID=1971739 RepID=UPI00329924D2